jgi:hypothetical protein
MSDNMILLNNEIPQANNEMPLGKMSDASINSEKNMQDSIKMPRGDLNQLIFNSSGMNTASGTGNMPLGDMLSSSSSVLSRISFRVWKWVYL